MPVPDTALPPHLRARYGVRSGPRWGLAVLAVVVGTLVVALGVLGYRLANPPVTSKLLAWRDVSAERVDITFEVRGPESATVYCVLRAQDVSRADVGYAVAELPPGSSYRQTTYRMRTVAPAYTAEVLECAAGEPPVRVAPPQFPAGVVPPEQPWTDQPQTGQP